VRTILLSILGLYLASILVVHFRGREKLKFRRQVFDHSGFFAPYNVLMYAFSKVPNVPFPDRTRFGALDPLRGQWQAIRHEALRLFDEGYIKAAEKNNDASFASFFKTGWKRFYLTWYGHPLQSAEALCPRTVALLRDIPEVKAAMFALLPPGARLNPHRDPFAGSLRYHLGLATPNSDACRIVVDGQEYSWRDGEDTVFDETFVHWAENRSDATRVILFCDVERPLRWAPLARFNRWIGGVLGRATATDNFGGEPVGVINRLYAFAERMGQRRKRIKRAFPRGYRVTRIALGLLLAGWLLWPWLAA